MKITETKEEMLAHLEMEIEKTDVQILKLKEKMKELLELKKELN